MPTIKKPNQHFDATLYTGDGASTKTVSGLNFQSDFIWIKRRDGASDHNLQDAVRGFSSLTKLSSSSSYGEGTVDGLYTDPKWGYVSAVSSTGFTVTKSTNGDHVNYSASPYVAWAWKAGNSTTVNTSGAISSNVSVNTTAGFSVVTYTGAGTGAGTVGHGLGAAPKFMIIKSRTNTANYAVYHVSLGINQLLSINTTGAIDTISNYWGSSSPTSTVFGVYTGNNIGNNNYLNQATVAYCWAEVAGYSKFGSYTGNGSTDGPFVYCGFLPRWVLIKQSSSAGNNWQLIDTVRETTNPNDTVLFPNTSGADGTGNATLDFLSNGFKVRTTDGTVNTNGSTYVFAAFAEAPFKYATAK